LPISPYPTIAITTAEILLENILRKKTFNTEKISTKIQDEEIHVSSTRGGYVIGKHTVLCDSPHDTIEISHSGKSRASYAIGAIKSAQWLNKKKGFFSINDYMDDMI
jgi:4-hydroxy-tetrahydrodipicolinate reductase